MQNTVIDPYVPRFLPATNQKVADMLFAVEVGLRELMIETLSEAGGVKWHKQLLPPDVTEKYVRGRKSQKAATWSNHVEHHPLYYIDFPDLAKILNKNWKQTFQELFGDKNVFMGSLRALEPIRNNLAHNRKLSPSDMDQVAGVFAQFQSALGEVRLEKLVENCTTLPALNEILDELLGDIEVASQEMLTLTAPSVLATWLHVRDAWWFDEQFLTGTNDADKLEIIDAKLKQLEESEIQLERERDRLSQVAKEKAAPDPAGLLDSILHFFGLHQEFAALPRGRGTGHQLEAWKQDKSPEQHGESAKQAIAKIQKQCNG